MVSAVFPSMASNVSIETLVAMAKTLAAGSGDREID
jgi:hypothetical protein